MVHPPCNIAPFLTIPLRKPVDSFNIVSIGQFRPEKDHELQLISFKLFFESCTQHPLPSLLLIGSCRDQEDHNRVRALKLLANTLGIGPHVEFYVNISFEELLQLLSRSHVGLHTMWNEHFGICIVELMAAGLIMVAHNSGGPQTDIISRGRTGFLCCTSAEYSEAFTLIHSNYSGLQGMALSARKSVEKYSEEAFTHQYLSLISPFLS